MAAERVLQIFLELLSAFYEQVCSSSHVRQGVLILFILSCQTGQLLMYRHWRPSTI